MAKQPTTRQKKLKLLERLMDANVLTEQQLFDLSPLQMAQLPGITTEEMGMLCTMLERVQAGTLYSYLCEQ